VNITAEEASLEIVQKGQSYRGHRCLLEIIDVDGRVLEILLDGVQVGDIIADARNCGFPVEWPYVDGAPR
jgi:hypothetical protein